MLRGKEHMLYSALVMRPQPKIYYSCSCRSRICKCTVLISKVSTTGMLASHEARQLIPNGMISRIDAALGRERLYVSVLVYVGIKRAHNRYPNSCPEKVHGYGNDWGG